MNETHDGLLPHAKMVLNWIAAILGIGTFAGMVNVVVGVLSGTWIAVQLWSHIRYEIPLKRAKLLAAQRGHLYETDRGDLK